MRPTRSLLASMLMMLFVLALWNPRLPVLSAAGEDPTTQPWFKSFEARQYQDKDSKVLLYRLAKPERLDRSAKPPLLIFLHGSASKGNNNIDQVVLWRQLLLDAVQQGGAVVIAPQCPTWGRWSFEQYIRRGTDAAAQTQSPATFKCLMEVIPQLQKEFNIDMDRLYVCGWSMGAAGTWVLLNDRPGVFAAAAVFATPGPPDDPEKIAIVAKVPVWIFQGADDVLLPPAKHSQLWVETLKKAGGNFRYTEVKGQGHDIRGGVSSEKDFLPWLFAQKLPAAKAPPVP